MNFIPSTLIGQNYLNLIRMQSETIDNVKILDQSSGPNWQNEEPDEEKRKDRKLKTYPCV